MKLLKLTFLFILFNAALTVTAQTQLTAGTFEVSRRLQDPPPQNIIDWRVGNGNFFSDLNQHYQSRKDISFFSNQQITGYTYVIVPSPEARGVVAINGGSCKGAQMAHPNQPLSTRLEMSLGAFRAPKFAKISSQPSFVEMIVPFTLTGRISCLTGTEGELAFTIPVTAAGNARLRFIRNINGWKRVTLSRAYFGIGIDSP